MNDKRQLLVEIALTLFYQYGVNSVGINQILKVSGVAKKTLYHHFASKEHLVLAALSLRNDKFIVWLSKELGEKNTAEELIEKLFTALHLWINNKTVLGDFRGCFFINTSGQFEQDSHISHYCQSHKNQVRQLIAERLSADAISLLEPLCLLKEGAITTAYVSADLNAAKRCIAIGKSLLPN